ncbi:MAG: pyruvate ferredoxin oxidoreductase [Desulfurella sp.]|uniref:pyruvate ferredoxin oxidoreductase n=1 Tax=Desulfurella sp. TaxID=1962857 RepID=UPI003C796662
MKKVLGGNDAVSQAVSVCDVEVISAYPITPQTSIIEKIADLIYAKQINAQFIKVESEHSAMAACIGASIAGSRTFTATSSQGLLLMHEVLHWASGARLPIVLANANRAIAPGWNIWAEATDSLSQRDTGWVQLYAANSQEVYDFIIMAFAVAERALFPVMVCLDGFLLTHTKEPVEILEHETVKQLLPKIKRDTLDPANPKAYGSLAFPKDYYIIKKGQHLDMLKVLDIFDNVSLEFEKITNRHYNPVEVYPKPDSQYSIVALGTLSQTARLAVDNLRKDDIDVNLVKINMLRPFPQQLLKQLLSDKKLIVVFDRDISHGKSGIVKDEIAGGLDLCNVVGFVGGLGGDKITESTIANAFLDAKNAQIKGLFL